MSRHPLVVLSLVSALSTSVAHAESSARVSLKADGAWRRFATQDGHDVNLAIKGPRGARSLRAILGPSRVTGDDTHARVADIFGAFELSLEERRPGVVARLLRRHQVVFQARGMRVVLGGESGDGAIAMSSLRLQRKSHWFSPYRTLLTAKVDGLVERSAAVDRSSLGGAAAAEVYQVLVTRGGAPNIDTDGSNYRGVDVAPTLLRPRNDPYFVRLSNIEVPTQLIFALNGLSGLGLRSSHPLFARFSE